jgi:hypothetical protein
MDSMGMGGGGSGGGGGGSGNYSLGSGGAKATLNWNDPKVKQALSYFMGQGHSMIASVGLVSNLFAESTMNEGAENPTSHAYGIAQWLGPRVKEFERVMGKPLRGSSFEDQLKFTQWELKNTHKQVGDKLDLATTIADAVMIIYSKFEAPGGADPTGPTRLANAQTLARNVPPIRMKLLARSRKCGSGTGI